MKKKASLYKIPLATTTHKGKVVLFSKIQSSHPLRGYSKSTKDREDAKIVFNISADGISFSTRAIEVEIYKGKKKVEPHTILGCKIFGNEDSIQEYAMTLEKISIEGTVEIFTAFSKNLKKWEIKGNRVPVPFARRAVCVPKVAGSLKQTIYYSDREIWAKVKKTAKEWNPPYIVINPRLDSFDSQPLEAMAYIPEEDGLFIVYTSQSFSGDSVDMSVGAVLCSYKDPGRVLWRSMTPLWQSHFNTVEYLIPIGGEKPKKNLLLYWMDVRGELIIVKIGKNEDGNFKSPEIIKAKGPLKRFERNPIIAPRADYDWEVEGTFNPAAYMDDEGIVHLLYRAIGHDGISRIGYARSPDGVHFTRRSPIPVFEPSPGYGLPHPDLISGPAQYNPLVYTSGGGWGGSEDPRVVKIENKIYMTYVAFEGWNSVRMALTSINENNLKKRNWIWKSPVLISPPGEVNKNWLIFPQKIKGKFAILHSITPKIQIAYVDSLDNFNGTQYVHSHRPQGPQPGRIGYWDSLIRGGGPPPLKIKDGWLLLYHALDKNDIGRYKMGAMILDAKDPTKILYRSNNPLLSPDMSYENEGKAGVVYASGAVIKNEKLYIYYGGGDHVVCAATAPINDFIDFVKHGKAPQLSFVRVKIM